MTWKHLWDQFEPEVQILQWYETEEEAKEVEKSIILATWTSFYSLNENCGGGFSYDSCSKAGKIGGKQGVKNKTGIHSEAYNNSEKAKEVRRANGRKTGLKCGLANVKNLHEKPESSEWRSKGGKEGIKTLLNHHDLEKWRLKGGLANTLAQQKP